MSLERIEYIGNKNNIEILSLSPKSITNYVPLKKDGEERLNTTGIHDEKVLLSQFYGKSINIYKMEKFKVCILAAGVGSRMGVLSQNVNKGILPINYKVFSFDFWRFCRLFIILELII